MAFPADFFFSLYYISPKNDVAENFGPFGIRKVPESQSMQK
jgi:hypothetical protein